ncbi:hypothetical protein [Sediminibacillus massiliensis]|uniref:hypothetical protein n=1 Tax=Sediminibacillus massiliensis TaxID=1926277 RepID=UPI0015C34E0D|nr:hypothetical protein [Sediminibacillus massiliensis]
MKIDVINGHLPKQCMEMVRNIYNHPNTNKHTKQFIRFELQRILGREYDIKGYLQEKSK